MSALKLLAIPFIAMALSAFAQNAPQPSPKIRGGYDECLDPGGGPRGVRFVDADTNHDGKLSRTEAQAMPSVAKHFDDIDADHDGYVTSAELRAARERFQATRRAHCGQNEPTGSSG